MPIYNLLENLWRKLPFTGRWRAQLKKILCRCSSMLHGKYSYCNRYANQKKFLTQLFEDNGAPDEEYRAIEIHEEKTFGQQCPKLLAFYLPQYHPVPENDEWWGKGFTEWANVTRAVPQFVGHYQPHLPGELGFYDLRLPEIMERQIELAKNYGIFGFCFHCYWFNGKRLLERPLDMFLHDSNLDFPFCICWANENWTRRWDGHDSEILIKQEGSEADDLNFIHAAIKIMKDSRYIRIMGKPLLLVYRAELLFEGKLTVARWREACWKQGLGEIFLAAVKRDDFTCPEDYGFDAAVEFPPHGTGYPALADVFEAVNPKFTGRVCNLERYVNEEKYLQTTGYQLFRGIFPGWDNTARRGKDAVVFWRSTPALYKKWLKNILNYTCKNSSGEMRYVFINAWNEWAEGAHLEPDRKHGYAYLQATYEALRECNDDTKMVSESEHDEKNVL